MSKKELAKNPSENTISHQKKPSKWNFISRFFKKTPKISRSKSKEAKKPPNNFSYNEPSKKPQDFSSFLNNLDNKNNGNMKFIEDSPSGISSYRPSKNNQTLSKMIENGNFDTPDKKFLKKMNKPIEINDYFSGSKEGETESNRPKKPLDSTRNKVGGLKYRNNLEKLQTKINRKFSFTHREKNLREILFNPNFFQEIVKYLSIGSLINLFEVLKKTHIAESNYKNVLKKQMLWLISKGLQRDTVMEKDEQYIFWNYFIHFHDFEKFSYQNKFNEMSTKNTKFEKDIFKDLDRTFPDLSFFKDEDNKRYLQKVLRAISNCYPEIGYIQGINAMVGVLLLNGLKENEVFWLIKFFLNKMDLKSIYSPGFPKIQILNYQLEIYLKVYMKDVFERLNSIDIGLGYFTTQWFITLYAYDLPMNTLLMIWNLFLMKGYKMIIKVALGLISLAHDEILNKDDDNIGEFLKNFVQYNFEKNIYNRDVLLKQTLAYKVTNRLLRNLEALYINSENPPSDLILQKNPISFKYEWKIIIPSKNTFDKSNPKNFSKRQSIKLLDEYLINYINDKNDKDQININNKKAQPSDKIKKNNAVSDIRAKGVLEININEMLTSRNLLVNNFNTTKNLNKHQFEFASVFLKKSFIGNTPCNKVSDFIIPIECKGDDGEIPDIEPILFEKKKSGVKSKAVSLHLNRELLKENMASPIVIEENDGESIGDLKKSKFISF